MKRLTQSQRDDQHRPYTPECEHPRYQPGEPTGASNQLGVLAWMEVYAETHEQRYCPHCERYAIWIPKQEGAHRGH